jgi:Raf kinase inhibitor-like YbhB/YbcL family protein
MPFHKPTLLLLIAVTLVMGLVFSAKGSQRGTTMLQLSSPAIPKIAESSLILKQYTCDGQDISPPFHIDGTPPGTKSLALIVDDPDAPMGTWVHWLLWNIPSSTKTIEEHTIPAGAVSGTNDFGRLRYGGPCPPSGTHRYYFKLYALDTMLKLPPGRKKANLLNAMQNHILAEVTLMGRYSRQHR